MAGHYSGLGGYASFEAANVLAALQVWLCTIQFRSLPIKQSTGDSLVSNEAIYRKNTEVVQPPLGIPHR
jgi:hypothetical protein